MDDVICRAFFTLDILNLFTLKRAKTWENYTLSFDLYLKNSHLLSCCAYHICRSPFTQMLHSISWHILNLSTLESHQFQWTTSVRFQIFSNPTFSGQKVGSIFKADLAIRYHWLFDLTSRRLIVFCRRYFVQELDSPPSWNVFIPFRIIFLTRMFSLGPI